MHFLGSKALSLQEDDKCIFYYTVLKRWMFLHSNVMLIDTKKNANHQLRDGKYI